MTDHDQNQQQWDECPAGALSALARRLNARHRYQRAVRITQFGALGLVVVAAGIVTGGLINARRGPVGPVVPVTLVRINCRECKSNFEAYHLHLTSQQPMDATAAEQMRVHLERCKGCRLAFQKQYPGVLIAMATGAAGLLLGICRRPVETATTLVARRA